MSHFPGSWHYDGTKPRAGEATITTKKPQRRRPKGTGSITPLASGSHRARWRGTSETFRLKGDAERWLTQQRMKAEQALLAPPPPDASPARTVADVITEWREIGARRWKPGTLDRYDDHATHIQRILGAEPITSLDARRMEAFAIELERTLKPKTVHACNGVLRLILGHAHRYGDIQAMPPKIILKRVTRPKLLIPTRGQVDELAAASDPRVYSLVMLAGYCGLREGEILGLHQADVNLAEGWVFVHQQRNRKTGKLDSTKTEGVRRVALWGPAAAALEQHLAEYPGDLVAPMTSPSGRWPDQRAMTASLMRNSWVRAREKVDMPTVRFHDLRHAAASMMIAAGLNVLQVSKQLGHANPTETLNTYGHLWPDSLAEAMQRMNAYLAA